MQTQFIEQKIFEIRGQKVMLVPMAIGIDLAALYEVETRVFNQSVKEILKVFREILCLGLQKKNGIL